jgi:hypothetical protein
MMAFMLRNRVTRWWLVVGVCTVLLAVGLGFYASRGPRAQVVDEAAASTGWKVLEYEGVRVDVPADWERLDQTACEFEFERWGPPGTGECDYDGGVAFYGASTFDPAHGPGIRRSDSEDEPMWDGYAYAGEFAVYASDEDRPVVAEILRSAEPVDVAARSAA